MTTYFVWGAAIAILLVVVSSLARRHALALVRDRRLKIDRFKLRSKHGEIRLDVFSDPEVVSAIRQYARENKATVEAAERQAHQYLTEIVPKFNLLAYYRLGAPIARVLLNFLYRVVVERNFIERLDATIPKGSVVIYVINHRSNVDYVLVAHMLFKFISLSYAVGEWARVWPLNHLFKWFGAYFIRRRFREPLYHAVLSTFVRTITRRGVTQGVFIEGGLSRDGAFHKPKLGMLDYIVTSKRDPEFRSPLLIVPTAINYDRVLEDRVLTRELLGREDRSTRSQKFAQTLDFLFKNALRSLFRRFKRYGYAIVTFGEPVTVDEFIKDHPGLLAAEFEQRKPFLRKLADLVMSRISEALPVTPVTLVAGIFSSHGSTGLSEEAIIAELEQRRGSASLLEEKSAAELWESAREILELRRLIEFEDGIWKWSESEMLLRDYYANALASYEDVKRRGWEERAGAG